MVNFDELCHLRTDIDSFLLERNGAWLIATKAKVIEDIKSKRFDKASSGCEKISGFYSQFCLKNLVVFDINNILFNELRLAMEYLRLHLYLRRLAGLSGVTSYHHVNRVVGLGFFSLITGRTDIKALVKPVLKEVYASEKLGSFYTLQQQEVIGFCASSLFSEIDTPKLYESLGARSDKEVIAKKTKTLLSFHFVESKVSKNKNPIFSIPFNVIPIEVLCWVGVNDIHTDTILDDIGNRFSTLEYLSDEVIEYIDVHV